METKTADGSETTNLGSEEISPNDGKAENCSACDVVSVSELVLELVEAASVGDGTSKTDNKAFDVEENLELGKQMTINDQDEEKMHIEESISLKRMLNTALNEKEDALKELTRLKTFESEATKLTKVFTEAVSDVLEFEDDSNLVEKLGGIIKYALGLRENEFVLQQQFANAELQIKILEDKLDVQSNLLQQEMKTRALKEDELNNTNSMLSRLETDLNCLKTKALDLEGRLKSSMDESEEFKQLAGQTEEDCIKVFERALELDYLLVMSESRTKEMEQFLISFQKGGSDFYQKPGSNVHTQELFNETEMELPRGEEPPLLSNVHEHQSEDSIVRVEELEAMLLASRLKEQELQEALNDAENRISRFQEMAKSSTFGRFEDETLAEVHKGVSEDAQENNDGLELDLNNALGRERSLQTMLSVSEEKLSTQARFVQHATARVKELEHLLGFRVNDAETKLQAAKENYACADPEIRKLSNKLNILVDFVKELDDQASHVEVSELAKEVELRVLYAKLAEIDIIVQKLQADVLVAETRAHSAEAEREVLSCINSKVDEEFRNLQARVNEILTAFHQIDNDKQSIAYQLTSTTKNINGLTKKIAAERQHLQKQLSSMVKDNLELTKKYMKVRNELDILLSEHESHQKNSKEREETHMEDLKVGSCEGSIIGIHKADLQQKFQFDEKKLEQDLWRESTTMGDFGGSHLPAKSMDIISENASKCQAAPAFGSESFADANSVWNLTTGIKSMTVVVLLVVIGLFISNVV